MEYQTSSRMGLIVSLYNYLSELDVAMIYGPKCPGVQDRIVIMDDPEGDFRRAEPMCIRNGGVTRALTLPGGLFLILSLSEEQDMEYRKKWGLAPRKESE